MAASLTAAKCKRLMFSVPGFALFYAANKVIFMIFYDFYLLPAQFCYIIVYTRKVESCEMRVTASVYIHIVTCMCDYKQGLDW
jgi:hypothetical protein